MAIMESRCENTYPHVILPMNKFTTAMTMMRLSGILLLEPEFREIPVEENRKREVGAWIYRFPAIILSAPDVQLLVSE
jgi:hypothetical protein